MKKEVDLDLLTHYADELKATADILKKSRDLKNYTFRNSKDMDTQIKTNEDLKEFLKDELYAYLKAIEEIS